MSHNNYMGKIDEDFSGTTIPNYDYHPMKKLDDLIKEDLKDKIDKLEDFISTQSYLYGYDKQEMIDYVIKELSKESPKEEK